MRAREYYGFALIAGIGLQEARRLSPGWVLDMYKLRVEHDARMMGVRRVRRTGLL